MEKANHALSALIISKAAEKHADVIRPRRQMINLKGMSRIIEFRVKVSQKSLNNPDEVAISKHIYSRQMSKLNVNVTSMKVPFTLGTVGHFGLAVTSPKRSAKWFERALGLSV